MVLKKVLLILAVAFATLTASAQIQLGVKAGLDYTNFSLNRHFFAEKNRTGLFFGPTMRVSIPSTSFGFDLSALYDRREGVINYGEEDETSIKQRQFIFPLNIRWQFGTDMLGIFVFAGPQVGFNLSGDKDFSLKTYQDVDWEWETSNVSLNIGAGVMILKQLQFSADYNINLGKTGEFRFSKLGDEIRTSSGRVCSCQIGLTYYF